MDSASLPGFFPVFTEKPWERGWMKIIATHDRIKCFFVSEPTAPPENFTAISLSFNSINVSWKPVPEEHRRGIIIGYQVKVQGNNGSHLLSFGGSENSGVIRNLSMFVDYKLCLLALTRIGGGPCANRTLQTKITGIVVKSLDFC